MPDWLKRSFLVFVVLAVAIQIIRPARTNPASDPAREIGAVLPVHPGVSGTFQRACNDCHSNQTRWPWYSNVAPVSWLVAHDVNEGRSELNFSEWGAYTAEKQQKLLGKICSEVKEGEMPGRTYTLMHSQAWLRESDRQSVCSWTQSLPGTLAAEERERD